MELSITKTPSEVDHQPRCFRAQRDAALHQFVTRAGFQVASVVVIDKMTASPHGVAFVQPAQGEDIQRAIAGLNGQSLAGRQLTVCEILGGESRMLFREKLWVHWIHYPSHRK
jgi:hypothetical protein